MVVIGRAAMLQLKSLLMNTSINTEELRNYRDIFKYYVSNSVRSQECHDEIGVMVYPVVTEKYLGMQVPIKVVIEEIRSDSEYLKDKEKDLLPVAFFSVSGFNGCKKSQNVTKHTGLIVIDIDKKDNLRLDIKQLCKEFCHDKHVYAYFRSPNGGVKVIFNTNIKDKEHHEIYFQSICTYLQSKYQTLTKIDLSGSNINRACYLPFDADAYFNPHAYKYCLDDQQITEISDKIKQKRLKTNLPKVILQVDFISFEEHYDNILNLLKNRTSVGLYGEEKRTSMGMSENHDSSLTDNCKAENRTSVGLYDYIFNNYRYNNIEEGIMSTDVPFLELIILRNIYPYRVDFTTHLDERYFSVDTQQQIHTNSIGLNGLEFCKVKLPKNGYIKEGFRYKTIASISMKLIFNNPFCHPDILITVLQKINDYYCENPHPSKNPKPTDEEVKNIVIDNYQKFITGELDFSKVIRKNKRTGKLSKKYVFRSRQYIKKSDRHTQLEAIRTFVKGKRDQNIEMYAEAVNTLQDGKKITQERIAKYMGMTSRNLRRYMTEENEEFFKKYKAVIVNYNKLLKQR